MGKNHYLEKQKALHQDILATGERMGIQKMWDYLQLTLRDPEVMGKDTFGKKRLDKVFYHMKDLADTYQICFTDYERYPEMKKIRYDKGKKGWRD